MAEPKAYILSPKTFKLLHQMLRDYLGGKLTNKPTSEPTRTRTQSIRLAKVTGATITASSSGTATLQKADWTTSGQDVDLTNDFAVDLPIGTKLLVAPVQGSWRVITIYNLECA